VISAGFEPGVFIGALGAFTGGVVVIWIKRLQPTESTRVIMFYDALWNTILVAIPTAICSGWIAVIPGSFRIADFAKLSVNPFVHRASGSPLAGRLPPAPGPESRSTNSH
jgi:hypothetical protein